MAIGTFLATIIPASYNSLIEHKKRNSVDTSLLNKWKYNIFIGFPIFKINTSPPLEILILSKPNPTASGIDIKYLVTSGSVTVIGPPFSI